MGGGVYRRDSENPLLIVSAISAVAILSVVGITFFGLGMVEMINSVPKISYRKREEKGILQSMKIFRWLFWLLIAGLVPSCEAQTGTVNGYCQNGGAKVSSSGIVSTTTVQQSFPSCKVYVYHTGTTNIATIYADKNSTPLDNPFTASSAGKFLFYAAGDTGLDVTIAGGTPPNVLTSPVTIYTNIFPSVPNGGGGGGCTTDCVITDPTSTQTITQPDETQFIIQGPAIDLSATTDSMGLGGAVDILAVSNSSTEISGNVTLSAGSTIDNSHQSGNIALGVQSTPGSTQSGNIAIFSVSAGGDQSGNITLDTTSSGDAGSIGGGSIVLKATAPTSSTLNQGRVGIVATNNVYFENRQFKYLFGGPSPTGENGGTVSGYGILDFSAMPSGSNITYTAPNVNGELGVIAGTPVAGHCPQFDSTGKWLVDSGASCGGGGGGDVFLTPATSQIIAQPVDTLFQVRTPLGNSEISISSSSGAPDNIQISSLGTGSIVLDSGTSTEILSKTLSVIGPTAGSEQFKMNLGNASGDDGIVTTSGENLTFSRLSPTIPGQFESVILNGGATTLSDSTFEYLFQGPIVSGSPKRAVLSAANITLDHSYIFPDADGIIGVLNGSIIPSSCIQTDSTGTHLVTTGSACGGGGSGTVTSFSAGTLSPLFSTSVANATTVPSLSFALSNAAANSVFGNFTGSSAPPSYSTAPVFNGSGITNIPQFAANNTWLGLNIFEGGAGVLNFTPATSIINQDSPQLSIGGQYWDGTQSSGDEIVAQYMFGSGTNPSKTLQFSDPFGSPGTLAISFPTLTDRQLTSGNCIQASTGGLLADTGSPCGSGGSGGPTLQSNTVNNTSQTVLNFTDSSTLAFTNPSGGIESGAVLNSPKVGGISVTGTPTTGQVLTATGSTASTWQTPSASSSFDILSDQKATGTGFSVKNEYASLTSGTPVTLLSRTGSGYISSLFLAFSGVVAYSSSTITVSVNGEATPSINTTLRNLFSNWFDTATTYGTKFTSFNSSTGAGEGITLSIPYNNGIVITLTPSATLSSTFFSVISGQTGVTDNFPNTRKLWMNSVDSATPASVNGLAFAPYTYETVANYAGANPGRLVGLHMLDDSTALTPVKASLEGNIAIYTDTFNTVRVPSTSATLGQIILDNNGNFQTITTAGTTSATANTAMAWGAVTGVTTTDGAATWTATVGTPLNIYRASKPYVLKMSVIDTNGNVETVTTAGTTGASAPTWPVTGSCPGTTTVDSGATWTCSLGSSSIKAALISSGTEDFFNLGFYGTGAGNNMQGNGGTSGINFQTGDQINFYRYFVNDPIRFNNSIGIIRQIGDPSQVSFTGNSMEGAGAFWYTQDTN